MEKNRIDALGEYLDQNTPQRYPIGNSELAGATDYIKDGYFRMLAVVMQQSKGVSDSQMGLFRRLIQGGGAEKTAEDYLRMALDIEIEDYLRYTETCRETDLKYRWVLDALILTCIQEKTDEQLALIAHFIESYGISKDELRYLAAMARAIVGMNTADYVTACEYEQVGVPAVFRDYRALIAQEHICGNDHMTILQPGYGEKVTAQELDELQGTDTPYIKLIGVELSADDEYLLEFRGREKVILEDCRFVGNNKNPIFVYDCEELIVRNSQFCDFSASVFRIGKVSSVLIDGCEFQNGCIDEDGGAVIYAPDSDSIGEFNLVATSFEHCRKDCKNPYTEFAFISNIKGNVDRCSFVDCWGYYNYGPSWNDNWQKIENSEAFTMFPKDTGVTNCTCEDCAPFSGK